MSRRTLASALLALTLPVAGASFVAPAAAVPAEADVGSDTARSEEERPREWKPPKPPQKFNPPAGVTFNRPLGSIEQRDAIRRQINRTVDSTPAGARIQLLSWNIRDDRLVEKLIAAHKRNVTVRVLVAEGNWTKENPNDLMDRLDRTLRMKAKKWSNDQRAKEARSKLRECRSSCRGTRGIAHAKYYLFSHVGPKLEKAYATDVVMHGSANATVVAAERQWNDLHTIKGRRGIYRYFSERFAESEKDKPVRPPYSRAQFKNFTIEFLPWAQRPGDPVLEQLNAIRCTGATGGRGIGGATHIRIGQTAFLDERGLAIATRLKSMWDRGCDIKIVYALMGNKVLKAVRAPTGRGPMPIQQITQDWQGDGVYDRYLHTKFMAVSGVYGNNTAADVVFNGSMNYSSKAMRSDETIGTVYDAKLRRQYAAFVDDLFANPPPGAAPRGRMAVASASTVDIPGPDRWRGIEP